MNKKIFGIIGGNIPIKKPADATEIVPSFTYFWRDETRGAGTVAGLSADTPVIETPNFVKTALLVVDEGATSGFDPSGLTTGALLAKIGEENGLPVLAPVVSVKDSSSTTPTYTLKIVKTGEAISEATTNVDFLMTKYIKHGGTAKTPLYILVGTPGDSIAPFSINNVPFVKGDKIEIVALNLGVNGTVMLSLPPKNGESGLFYGEYNTAGYWDFVTKFYVGIAEKNAAGASGSLEYKTVVLKNTQHSEDDENIKFPIVAGYNTYYSAVFVDPRSWV